MKKLFFSTLMLFCTAVFAQTKSITLPESTRQIKNDQLVSKVIFSKIASGSLKIYTTMECKKIMTIKEFRNRITDSSIITMVDSQSGEVTGVKTVATLYQPDSLVTLSVHKPAKTVTTLGFERSMYSTTGVLLGQSHVCYFKYEDIEKIVLEFESKNYPTGFTKQMKKFL